MIYKVLEYDYKGFHLVLDEEDGVGWKCVIGGKEIKFPNAQAAEATINEILEYAKQIIKKNGGKVLRTVSVSKVTKTVEVENPY